MSLAQGNNTPTRPRIEPGSPDPESDALTTRPVRSPIWPLCLHLLLACHAGQCKGLTGIVVCLQLDDDMDWAVIKPHVFSTVMDFFTTGLPVLTDEQPSPDTSKNLPKLDDWTF